MYYNAADFSFTSRFSVQEKTLKGTHGVRPNNRKVLREPGPRTKYFECLFLLFNKLQILNKYKSFQLNF